ncbi:unnamed protein product [Fusarium graminearum]|nr:unnamed protein product [Fusarium graminearum]
MDYNKLTPVVATNLHRLTPSEEQLYWPFGTIRSCGAPGAKLQRSTVQFRDDKSYFEAKAAWHVARAEYNRYQAVYHETAAKRHREWLQSDIGTAAKLKEEEAKEPSIEELIAQAQAAIEEKKAASKRVVIDSSAVCPLKTTYMGSNDDLSDEQWSSREHRIREQQGNTWS